MPSITGAKFPEQKNTIMLQIIGIYLDNFVGFRCQEFGNLYCTEVIQDSTWNIEPKI